MRRISGVLGSKGSKRMTSLAALRARASEIRAALREAKGRMEGQPPVNECPRALEACAKTLQEITDQTRSALDQLAAKRLAAGDAFRLLQATYGVFRNPATPDWPGTILITMVFWLLEGGMAGAILISEGRMDVPAGLAYGLIFALTNIIAGLLIGYLPLRYLTYRSPIDLTASDAGAGVARGATLIRRISAIGLGIGLAAEGILIFGAARLRALGTHQGVFDFSKVGFWETFDDSLAIIIAVIGVCSVILAILKGYRGLGDPIPGYSEAYLQATAEMDEAAVELAEQAEGAIEAACDATLEHAEDLLAEAREVPEDIETRLLQVAREIDAFNDDVRGARDEARREVRRKRGLAAFVSGREPGSGPSDDSAFEALIILGIDGLIEEARATHAADLAPLETAMSDLEAERERQLAEIRTALAAFRAGTPNLDALIDEENDHG